MFPCTVISEPNIQSSGSVSQHLFLMSAQLASLLHDNSDSFKGSREPYARSFIAWILHTLHIRHHEEMEKPFKNDDDSSSETPYSPLHFFTKMSTKSSSGRLLKNITSGVVAFVILLVFGLVTIRLMSSTTVTSDCGNSASEARTKNCKFDQLLYAWVPDTCFAKALHEQYLANAPNAKWFLHTDTSEVTDTATVEEGQIEIIYTNEEWRGQQCTYLWESLGLGVYEGKQVVERAANLTQSTDCARLFLDVFDLALEWNSRKWLKQKLQFLKCRDLSATDL